LDFFGNSSNAACLPDNVSLTSRSHPSVGQARQRTKSFVNVLTRSHPETVPYKIAIQNRKTLLSSTESRESLAHQVVTFQDKLTKLEQDKEHWMLEAQLLQMKYEKEVQKLHEMDKAYKMMQARLSGTIEDNMENTDTLKHAQPNGAISTIVESSMLGQLVTVPLNEKVGDAREELIKSHFTHRIADLMMQLQHTDSKALNFSAECRALHKRLSQAQREMNRNREELTSANQTIAQLKDDLQTTTRSYEGQLSMMSEHLAGMNEKLTVQKDEIDVLKYQLQNAKGVKKGKVK